MHLLLLIIFLMKNKDKTTYPTAKLRVNVHGRECDNVGKDSRHCTEHETHEHCNHALEPCHKQWRIQLKL